MGEIDEMNSKNAATLFAILAAGLYAINIPLSKIILEHASPTITAGLLYLGAGIGIFGYSKLKVLLGKGDDAEPLTKKELPYTIAMVVLDIAAPIMLMVGITMTNSSTVSLLNNFEIVGTTIVALLFFNEKVSIRLWIAIILITFASVILSFDGKEDISLNVGALLVLGAAVCWGFENNCTRMISNKNTNEIVIIKGLFSGVGSIITGLVIGDSFPQGKWIAAILLLGFVSYGLSINMYIMAQKHLGAAKTSAYYSVAPFLGVIFSFVLLGESISIEFFIGLIIMAISAVLLVKDNITLQHTHEHVHTHTHQHSHGDMVHTHEHQHRHVHQHVHNEDENFHGHQHKNKNKNVGYYGHGHLH